MVSYWSSEGLVQTVGTAVTILESMLPKVAHLNLV